MSTTETTLERHELARDLDNLQRFVLGGHSTITLENTQKGTHVTLRLKRAATRRPTDAPGPIFVKAFVGSREELGVSRNFRYIGCVWTHDKNTGALKPAPEWSYSHRKAKLSESDDRVTAAAWLLDVINGKTSLPEHVRVWHEGRCCYCNTPLTQPESVKRGYGPECAGKRGLPYGKVTVPGSVLPAGMVLNPLLIPCPHKGCNAGAGESCRTTRGSNPGSIQSRPHKKRVTLARKQAAAAAAATNPAPSLPPAPTAPERKPAIPAPGQGDTFDERVADLMSYGLSQLDAEARARREYAEGRILAVSRSVSCDAVGRLYAHARVLVEED